ncbi:MAG: hypothetical protein ACYTGN_14515 [Planctomycetota bacterium]|jgi:hypothetical protein
MNRALWGLLIVASFARADALMTTRAMKATTIAEVFVGEGGIRVDFEIGAADAPSFSNLLAREGDNAESLGRRLAVFFREDWVVTVDGAARTARVTAAKLRPRIERDPITGEPAGESGEQVVFVRLEYALDARPKSIALRAPRGATVGFVVYHEGIAVNDFRYLAGEPVVDLDWDDPFYSRFRSRNLVRRYDAPLNAFLYVDAYEVRQEIICRPRDLADAVGLELGDVIRAADRAEIQRKVVAFFEKRNKVAIDGKPARGELMRVNFVRRSLKATGIVPPGEDIPVQAATLGVIFSYPVPALPREVTMTWDVFTPRVAKVPAVATDEAGGLPSVLTREDPVLTWQNFLKNPTPRGLAPVPEPGGLSVPIGSVVALLLGAVGAVRWRPYGLLGLVAAVALWPFLRWPAGADDVPVEVLLRNTYHAFDYRCEEAIYDTLSASVDGPLLERVYLETRRALELANQGGARTKVTALEMERIVLDGDVAECAWVVTGSIGHWGHIHTRRVRYEARLSVRAVDGAWKIVDLELTDERRL